MRPHLQYLNKYLNNGNISEVKKHKNSLCNMRTNDATADLMTVISLYQDFASTSPTAYSKATAELEAALVVFDAADKGDPVSVDMPSASSCSPLRCYSLTGIRTDKAVPGISIIKSDGGNAKKVVNR